ncbi:MAG TPA: MurT ligase domain-containing protein [Streptosporangiaceae bacterium]|nr:MurT ligase domain-containing protein [Streptosporangiaceae bacterium]
MRIVASRPPARPGAGRPPVTPSAQARLTLALAGAKAAGTASRMLGVGGGTSFPGIVARRIDPRVLQKAAAASDARTVVVTGSNGKTTTCRMLAVLAQAAGLRVNQNRSGSNLLQGVISAAVRGTDLRGRMDAQLLLLEVDEATVRLVASEVDLDTLLITNIFRDQLDRFGELYAMARKLEEVIEALPASATVVLNGDDPLVASLAPQARARRLYYGIRRAPGGPGGSAGSQVPEHAADTIRCVRCQHLLDYRAVYLSHLGDYHCPACGNTRPRLDVAVTAVRPSPEAGSEITVATPAGIFPLRVPLPGMHNVYNAAAALAGEIALSLPRPLPPGEARDAMAGLRPAFGRLEEIQAGDRRVVLAFVKNPTAYNATLREVLARPGRKHVLAAHSNTVVDGEDFAWLWDVDLEQLVPQLASLVVSGTRAEEVWLRFKYAGARPEATQVLPGRPAALDAALTATPPDEPLYIFAGYTPMRELRGIMQRRGWVRPSWEE